jgi:hypothetical protein
MQYVDDLVATVERSAAWLSAVPADVASRRPAPAKWSPKEIIGHLIDSASNNHQRFVRAQFQDDLIFPGYAQDDWVGAQAYQGATWSELIALWRGFNLHLAHVMRAMPEETRMRTRVRHNLHQLAFRAVPEHQPTTLDYFMRDYVDHLRHHLAQIEAAVGAPTP